MKTEIYYFSGTGNSLHVAKEISKQIPGSHLIPMVSLLKQDTIQIQADKVVLVYPTHLMTIPYPVRQFLLKADFSQVSCISAAATYLGILNISDIAIDRIITNQNKQLNSFFLINMVCNSATGVRPGKGDPRWKNMITPEEIDKKEKNVSEAVPQIVKAITNSETHLKRKGVFRKLIERLITPLTKNAKEKLRYYADDTCTSCGLCAQVCPSDKIIMKEGKPLWLDDVTCYYCYACFNFCPEQAVLLPNFTEKKGRFHHPDVSAEEIASQKRDR